MRAEEMFSSDLLNDNDDKKNVDAKRQPSSLDENYDNRYTGRVCVLHRHMFRDLFEWREFASSNSAGNGTWSITSYGRRVAMTGRLDAGRARWRAVMTRRRPDILLKCTEYENADVDNDENNESTLRPDDPRRDVLAFAAIHPQLFTLGGERSMLHVYDRLWSLVYGNDWYSTVGCALMYSNDGACAMHTVYSAASFPHRSSGDDNSTDIIARLAFSEHNLRDTSRIAMSRSSLPSTIHITDICNESGCVGCVTEQLSVCRPAVSVEDSTYDPTMLTRIHGHLFNSEAMCRPIWRYNVRLLLPHENSHRDERGNISSLPITKLLDYRFESPIEAWALVLDVIDWCEDTHDTLGCFPVRRSVWDLLLSRDGRSRFTVCGCGLIDVGDVTAYVYTLRVFMLIIYLGCSYGGMARTAAINDRVSNRAHRCVFPPKTSGIYQALFHTSIVPHRLLCATINNYSGASTGRIRSFQRQGNLNLHNYKHRHSAARRPRSIRIRRSFNSATTENNAAVTAANLWLQTFYDLCDKAAERYGLLVRRRHEIVEEEYLRHLRDSAPQTRYALAQWNSLYSEYHCEVCTRVLAESTNTGSFHNTTVTDLSRVCSNGRYMACVNVKLSLANDVAANFSLHVCNFLPIVLGTELDRRVRGVAEIQRIGQVFAFNNFWMFNSFISTDARQCHRYRARTNSTKTTVRMYIYDRHGKGHMLYIDDENRLCLRDRHRREIRLHDSDGAVLWSTNAEASSVVHDFVSDALIAPFDEMSPLDFFANCREYMLYGVQEHAAVSAVSTTIEGQRRSDDDEVADDNLMGDSDDLTDHRDSDNDDNDDNANSTSAASAVADSGSYDEFTLGFARHRDIDHIDNKRISSAPGLYAMLMHSFVRSLNNNLDNLRNETVTVISGLDSRRIVSLVHSCVGQYGIMSHRANLLPFISRKTHIRYDWGESMKRVMKSEIRSTRVLDSQFQSNGNMLRYKLVMPSSMLMGSGTGCIASTVTSLPASQCGIDDTTNRHDTATSSLLNDSNIDNSIAPWTFNDIVKALQSVRFRAPDVQHDIARIAQQFYCSKIHNDTEYDHELVKRMRVINLSAMNCLRMPDGFERFMSYFNVGNIGNAGRVMTRTHGMRESYISSIDETIAQTARWLRRYFVGSMIQHAGTNSSPIIDDQMETVDDVSDRTTTSDELQYYTIISLNEMPLIRTRYVIAQLHDRPPEYLKLETFSLLAFMLAVKYRVPGASITVSRLNEQAATNITDYSQYHARYCINIRIMYGVPLCPVLVKSAGDDAAASAAAVAAVKNEPTIDFAPNVVFAKYCSTCLDYRVTDAAYTIHVASNILQHAWAQRLSFKATNDGCLSEAVLPRCRKHVWLSRHELTLYEQMVCLRRNISFLTAVQQRPFLHEIACHGLLSVASFPECTDISKLIVSINAHRRAVRTETITTTCEQSSRSRSVFNWFDNLTTTQSSAAYVHDSVLHNGKITTLKLTQLPNESTTTATEICDASRLVPRNSMRLMFAFGDLDMLNCEDGYVVSDRLALTADTVYSKKIALVCRAPVSIRTKMTLEYQTDQGVRLHIGTLSAYERVNFTITSGVQVYHREPVMESNGTSPTYSCDIYLVWNTSFVQSRNSRGLVHAVKLRERVSSQIIAAAAATLHKDGSSSASSSSSSSSSSLSSEECLLHEEREYERAVSPITSTLIEIYDRYMRIVMRATDTKQTIKLQNSFGQKGIAHYGDLTDLVTDRGEDVHIISSMYSLVGRSACGQLLEQRTEGLRRVLSRRQNGRCVGVAGYGYFFVSSDSTHNNFIYSVKRGGQNPMRLCRLTYESLLENCASSTAFVKASEFESNITNPYAGLPRNVGNALHCYNIYGRNVEATAQRLRYARKRRYDETLLQLLHDLTATRRSTAATTKSKRRPTTTFAIAAKKL